MCKEYVEYIVFGNGDECQSRESSLWVPDIKELPKFDMVSSLYRREYRSTGRTLIDGQVVKNERGFDQIWVHRCKEVVSSRRVCFRIDGALAQVYGQEEWEKYCAENNLSQETGLARNDG